MHYEKIASNKLIMKLIAILKIANTGNNLLTNLNLYSTQLQYMYRQPKCITVHNYSTCTGNLNVLQYTTTVHVLYNNYYNAQETHYQPSNDNLSSLWY